MEDGSNPKKLNFTTKISDLPLACLAGTNVYLKQSLTQQV
jgi:hypothetical protein